MPFRHPFRGRCFRWLPAAAASIIVASALAACRPGQGPPVGPPPARSGEGSDDAARAAQRGARKPPAADQAAENPDVAALRRWAVRAEGLGPLVASAPSHPWLSLVPGRADVVRSKHERLRAGDPAAAARLSGLLAGEAQLRASLVLDRWIGRIDPATGLLPRGVEPDDHTWDYADTAADLYPHLLIAANLIRPELAPPLARVIPAERALTARSPLPDDVDLGRGRLEDGDLDDRLYGAAEYAKDGLLPLTERLGPGPWLERMAELADAVEAAAPLDSPFGRIPSQESEINGQTLQFVTRLYWATGEERHYALAERIARAYLEQALPATNWIPARTFDFQRGRPNSDHAQLRDHGNETMAGLVEFHLAETHRNGPHVARHRAEVRAMLDQLLVLGRTPDGLWKSAIDLDTGKPLKDTLSDSWGYLYAAYLTQAMVEERYPDGDLAVARRYREAAEAALEAVARHDLYPWQGSEQDGYADTIESALYLLNRLDSPAAAEWVDEQAGTLFGAQEADGRVEDHYLDGNFVRTALLYAAWQTRGVRVEPWADDVMLGAAPDGDCLVVVLAADRPWQGRLVFDTPRHRLHLRLPFNYPRLNEWPEWFAAEARATYRVEGWAGRPSGTIGGNELQQGIAVQLAAAGEQQLRVCPAR